MLFTGVHFEAKAVSFSYKGKKSLKGGRETPHICLMFLYHQGA